MPSARSRSRHPAAFSFLILVAVAVWWGAALSTEAQPAAKLPRVGVLLFGTPESDPNVAALRAGLRDLGYVDGKNIALEYRFAEGKPERLAKLAVDLAQERPNLIFALGGDVAPFARTATSTIPIVIVVSVDPVEAGLVASLTHPGGNLTGVTLVSSELAAKRLQLLKEIAPRVSRVGVLWNPDHVDPEYRATQAAARNLGVQIQSLEVRGPGDFDAAFRSAEAGRVEAIVVVSSRLMLLNSQRITVFGTTSRIALVTGFGPWAQGGALFSYGPDTDDAVRRATLHVDKILKGAKPGDLPVEQPTKFDLVINLKTASALGLAVPPSLRLRADRLIE
jgi:putative tryptophan/tyrosine transport system substrate-binding protein